MQTEFEKQTEQNTKLHNQVSLKRSIISLKVHEITQMLYKKIEENLDLKG